jgi:hypothetical protein
LIKDIGILSLRRKTKDTGILFITIEDNGHWFKNLGSGADRTGTRSYIDDFFYRSQAQLTPKAILNLFRCLNNNIDLHLRPTLQVPQV